jgi:sec-independent protein translocase protein TatA
MFGIGTTEMIVFGIIAVILFGGRLPSVARSLGKSIVEFKKGMTDIENEVKSSIYTEPDRRIAHDDNSEPTSPRFEPPKSAPEDGSREKDTADVA